MISLDLDLAMFASPDNASDGGLAGESTPRPVDPETTPAAAPATASPGPPWPEPDEPQSLTQPAPGPGAEPRSSPKVTHASQPKKTRLIPSQVQKPRPEPRPKPNPERASEPRRRVPPTPTPPRESVRTPSDLRPAEPRPLVERKAPTDRPGAPLRTAPGSPRAERSVTADSGPSPAARASAERTYLADLRRAIAGHQRFPEEARRRHATGVATVAFVVQANGQIDQVRIGQSSGDPALDQAAIQTLSRLGRFRPIPSSIGRSRWPMRVPIRFNLR
jgi:protein TonB